jgi:hypothetical protein
LDPNCSSSIWTPIVHLVLFSFWPLQKWHSLLILMLSARALFCNWVTVNCRFIHQQWTHVFSKGMFSFTFQRKHVYCVFHVVFRNVNVDPQGALRSRVLGSSLFYGWNTEFLVQKTFAIQFINRVSLVTYSPFFSSVAHVWVLLGRLWKS